MGHGVNKVFTSTMVSGNTTTSSIDLIRGWGDVFLEIPTMPSNVQVHIQGSTDGTNFRRIKIASVATSTVQINDFAIASAATNCMIPIPVANRYIKVETTATVDNGATFKVVCSDGG